MALSDYQEQYEKAETPDPNKPHDAKNDFPDGEYRIRILGLKKAVSEKTGGDLLFLDAEVLTPGYEGKMAGNCWAFSQRKGIEYTLSDVKAFITASGIDVTLSQLDESGYLAAFQNVILHGKKETNGKYCNWKYWRADEEYQTAKKELDAIDLDQEPFVEENPL